MYIHISEFNVCFFRNNRLSDINKSTLKCVRFYLPIMLLHVTNFFLKSSVFFVSFSLFSFLLHAFRCVYLFLSEKNQPKQHSCLLDILGLFHEITIICSTYTSYTHIHPIWNISNQTLYKQCFFSRNLSHFFADGNHKITVYTIWMMN